MGQADSVQYYGLFIVHQVYIQKPWFMLLCMLVIDIDFVRTFIIQVFLTRNELNDPRLRSGFSFLSQVKGKFKEDFFKSGFKGHSTAVQSMNLRKTQTTVTARLNYFPHSGTRD